MSDVLRYDNNSSLASGSANFLSSETVWLKSQVESDPILYSQKVPAPHIPHQDGYGYLNRARLGWTGSNRSKVISRSDLKDIFFFCATRRVITPISVILSSKV